MHLKQVPLEEASADERLVYAREILNLDLDEGSTDEQVISKIRSAQPGLTGIFVPEEPEAETERQEPPHMREALVAEAEQQASRGSLGRDDPKAVINITEMETEESESASRVGVMVGVNGVFWQLQRGVNASVPWRVVEALRNTEQTIIRHDKDGNTISRKHQRVPFTIVTQPSAEEIAAWHKRTDAVFCP